MGGPFGAAGAVPASGAAGGPASGAGGAAVSGPGGGTAPRPGVAPGAGPGPSAASDAGTGRSSDPDAAMASGGVAAVAGGTGASLTADELCRAAGLSAEGLAELERFGLLESLAVAGVAYYDEHALTVASLAGQLAAFGVEPRHLRLYRNAVDREVGLIEQIITPLLRQRNPEARQRAVSTTRDLVRLGESLRSALVRKEIDRQFGGQFGS